MDCYKIKSILEKVKTKDYDQVILCLTDCEEIILKPGDRVNFDIYNNFLEISEVYDDGFNEWDTIHYINAEHLVQIRVETKKDNIKLKDDDLDDYHKDLEEDYKKLVDWKKDKPYKSVVVNTLTYPSSRRTSPPEVWYLKGLTC